MGDGWETKRVRGEGENADGFRQGAKLGSDLRLIAFGVGGGAANGSRGRDRRAAGAMVGFFSHKKHKMCRWLRWWLERAHRRDDDFWMLAP